MKEAWWVFAMVLLMMLVGLARAVPTFDLLAGGQIVMLYGAGFGVPLEAVYFTALGVALTANGQRPDGWYWRPFVHHHLLEPKQRWLVLPFYYCGALAFAIATLGIAIVLSAILALASSV